MTDVTYRIQFNSDFTFTKLIKQLPYLHSLGIRTIYASPIFEAVPGSMHGYDVTNPNRINPEIGTEAELREIHNHLQSLNMTWVQDIVPNHMAYHPANLLLMDVLEKGRHSVYADYFDLAWTSPLYHGRIILPILGNTLEEILAKGEIKIVYTSGKLFFQYYENQYPIHPRSYASLLDQGADTDTLLQFISQVDALHSLDDAISYTLRWHELLLQFKSIMETEDPLKFLNARLQVVQKDDTLLRKILDEQHYQFTLWQVADKRISFRRFFTVNELIGVNVQHAKVFESHHTLINKLYQEGIIQGVRIDHIDGLFNPDKYLKQLRQLLGDDAYIVVEKILQADEKLPKWPIEGASGYEFLALVNPLLAASDGEEPLNNFYIKLTGDDTPIREAVFQKKAYMLANHMQGELNNLVDFLSTIVTDVDAVLLKECVADFLIHFPVYRHYADTLPVVGETERTLKNLLADIQTSKPVLRDAALALDQLLLTPISAVDPVRKERATRFYMRAMQLTGPLMAKGVEDTLFYTYHRFIAHNEVGHAIEPFSLDVERFHTKMKERQQNWPHAMNATATHDTKRGEDVRARLNVLSSLHKEWINVVQQWVVMNEPLKRDNMPDRNDEYLLYQTLVGTFTGEDDSTYRERIKRYMEKALRESKRNSDWAAPNTDYEEATYAFVDRLLNSESEFYNSFIQFVITIQDAGFINSLAQVILKFTAPGIPDVYQGCELWDFSLVDPDNRRPIDYSLREKMLANEMDFASLWNQRKNGNIKLHLTHLLCSARKSNTNLFHDGQYIPLGIQGNYRQHLMAYARHVGDNWLLVVAPLHTASLISELQCEITNVDWKDTKIILPNGFSTTCTSIFSHKKITTRNTIYVRDLFEDLPFAVLTNAAAPKDRAAGTLMHVTSLPGMFGMGDLGPSAYDFVDFLKRAGQTYWQLLPLNPTEGVNGNSPCSVYSSMAGNPLMISMEKLVALKLLQKDEVTVAKFPLTEQVEYEKVRALKTQLLDKAWHRFKSSPSSLHVEFENFKIEEQAWLHGHALYEIIKIKFPVSWNEWPEDLRDREPVALKQLIEDYADDVQKIKWMQFIFHIQWMELRTYCHRSGVFLIGDIPFYVTHDSVDVWSNPSNFKLDSQGKIEYMAGVPPDYFNEEGQLWGMPVYDWEAHAADNFAWWKQRLKKNFLLYDKVRLDHFRAFADFWQVRAPAKNAVNGKWIIGPRKQFFDSLAETFEQLPLIAEDLGEITPEVLALRDDNQLPGMKVLQFAFGKDIATSPHAPHNFEKNFIVYSGTHDNNTTVGWFNELSSKDKKIVVAYLGQKVTKDSVAKQLIHLAYSSVANIAIVPMQDILSLDESARMNMPGSPHNNWRWRLKELPDNSAAEDLKRLAELFERY